MSFNRVLPRPLGLDINDHISSAGKPNLCEYKVIMNAADQLVPRRMSLQTSAAADRTTTTTIPPMSSPLPSLPPPPPSPAYLPSSSSVNKAKLAGNNEVSSSTTKIPIDVWSIRKPSTASDHQQDTPMLDRSSSSSPEKSGKDAPQFCLCRPDPKIPRPRNG